MLDTAPWPPQVRIILVAVLNCLKFTANFCRKGVRRLHVNVVHVSDVHHLAIIPHRQYCSVSKVRFYIFNNHKCTHIQTGSDPETIDTGTIPSRYASILETKSLMLGGHHRIKYDMEQDMVWRWDQVLKTHPNGMRFSVFGEDGDLLATNEYFR